MSQISKAQPSESDADFIKNIKIITIFLQLLFLVKMARQLNPREAWIKFPQNIKNMGDVKCQIKFKTKDQIKRLKVNLKQGCQIYFTPVYFA